LPHAVPALLAEPELVGRVEGVWVEHVGQTPREIARAALVSEARFALAASGKSAPNTSSGSGGDGGGDEGRGEDEQRRQTPRESQGGDLRTDVVAEDEALEAFGAALVGGGIGRGRGAALSNLRLEGEVEGEAVERGGRATVTHTHAFPRLLRERIEKGPILD